jgi:hypothetical protein
MKGSKVLHSLHQAAVALGNRRATTAEQKVSPKVGKKLAHEAAVKLGKKSHKNS